MRASWQRQGFSKPSTGPKLRLLRTPAWSVCRSFFEERDCPAHKFAGDFIDAADDNDLDWRLLPSISYVESGGGKEYRNNNILGWANAEKRFQSVRAGIHSVARRLAVSPLYRDKSVDAILHTYNPEHGEYVVKVKAVMRQIAKSELLQTAFN